jgi:DNA (cytosine-5)-methyltransferase 1
MSRAPAIRTFLDDELIVDSFAGGGGASLGIEEALGRSPDIAINHDAEAIAMHQANHPGTTHYCENVWKVDPLKATKGKRVGLMWLSPDCKHFSKAKGGKPVEKKIRGLAWIAFKWVKDLGDRKPRVIILENVEEFADWGPVLEDGRPCPLRRGLTFRRFVRQLSKEGYVVDWRELVAADYGAPTTRKRLFLIARCDGEQIVWPDATHAPAGKHGLKPWRSAAECIEWQLPCPSIFTRERPLAENTMRRIARGIDRYVVNAPSPFIVPTNHAGGPGRSRSVDVPLRTVDGSPRGSFAMVAPVIARIGQTGGNGMYANDARDPVTTITSKGEHLLVSGFLKPRYGEREGQAPRCIDVNGPAPTVVPTGNGGDLVTAYLAKHNGGHEATGQPLSRPADTVTATDQKALTTATIVKFRGTNVGQAVTQPLQTISAGGDRGGIHFAEVRAFLMKYHANGGQWSELGKPMPTVLANDSLGLVTVQGEQYAIADIGMRMLQPRELFRAQGFRESYVIDRDSQGNPFTKTAQVRMCGNSVCPPLAAALVRANLIEAGEEARVA